MVYEEYDERLDELKDIHRGDRCFIMGCGPSLNKQDLKPLENEIVIGLNATYLVKDMYDIDFKYYVLNEYGAAFKPRHKKILGLETILFMADPSAKEYKKNEKKYRKYKNAEVILLKTGELICDNNFTWMNRDLKNGICRCVHTPAAMGLPVAYHLGFDNVYLIGIDMEYRTHPNYFYGDREPSRKMFIEGYYERSSKEFRGIANAFEDDGRKVYNATAGGKLDLLDRVNLEDIL